MTYLKKLAKAAYRFAWLLGGQKEHARSNIPLPTGSYVEENARLIFPENIRLGENVLVLSGASLICSGIAPYLMPSGAIQIGEGSVIRENAILQTYGGKIRIGRDVTINPFCVIQGNGGVVIGDHVLIAAGVKIFSANHVFNDPNRLIRKQGETRKGVKIGDDVWIGANVTILDGVIIGSGSVIAAGAVVNSDVPPKRVFAGVPAKLVKSR